ncbi:hypothetical protein ABZ318_20555, partial [Streptomyces sp. NPDC006197]|uniref:hypothetical protein n=1 Tax=Streptomyces sp. NPDC006197 TaxID=3156685 RepID=UPI0033BF4D7D
MTASRAPLLVAVSGPDTAGTSSLVRRLATLLRERGATVVVLPCHGCLLCRRLPAPPHVRETAEPGRDARARATTVLTKTSCPEVVYVAAAIWTPSAPRAV